MDDVYAVETGSKTLFDLEELVQVVMSAPRAALFAECSQKAARVNGVTPVFFLLRTPAHEGVSNRAIRDERPTRNTWLLFV